MLHWYALTRGWRAAQPGPVTARQKRYGRFGVGENEMWALLLLPVPIIGTSTSVLKGPSWGYKVQLNFCSYRQCHFFFLFLNCVQLEQGFQYKSWYLVLLKKYLFKTVWCWGMTQFPVCSFFFLKKKSLKHACGFIFWKTLSLRKDRKVVKFLKV